MTKLKEVTYFKDPPGRYTWAKHCHLCDSMKYTFEKVGDSVVLQGERRCDTLCNIVARYSRNIGSLVYKAAFLYDPDITPRKVTAKPVDAGAKTAGSPNTTGKITGNTVVTAKTAGASTNLTSNANNPGAVNTNASPTNNTSATNNAKGTAANTVNTSATNNAGGTAAKTGGVNTGLNFVQPVYKDSLLGRDFLAGRTVNTPNRYVINADSAELRFMDNGIVDGDTISVFYNGQLIVPKLSLKEQPYIIKLPLFPDYPNRLVIHAESLGIYPPNTALVRIIYGKKEQSFLLSSSMSKSGSIELMNNSPLPPKGGGQLATGQ
jgi:hypothetical protein